LEGDSASAGSEAPQHGITTAPVANSLMTENKRKAVKDVHKNRGNWIVTPELQRGTKGHVKKNPSRDGQRFRAG